MEPFSDEILTILVLISLSLASITFLIICIFTIISLCKFCINRRHQLNLINPQTRSPSIVSLEQHTSIPILKVSKKSKHSSDNQSIFNEQKNHSFQQQEYLCNDCDETTTTTTTKTTIGKANESLRYPKHLSRPIKPLTDVRNLDRQTPYPADVLAREKLMYNNRLSMNDKY